MDGHSSSEVCRHLSADPARNKKKKKSFGFLECVHLLHECVNCSFQADVPTNGNLEAFLAGCMNMSGNRTCFIDLTQQHPAATTCSNAFNTLSTFSLLQTSISSTYTPDIIILQALAHVLLVRKKPCKDGGKGGRSCDQLRVASEVTPGTKVVFLSKVFATRRTAAPVVTLVLEA